MTQRALPRSGLGKAIAYTSGLWPGLVRFLSDPKIPLDTNSVERALRGVAVGRDEALIAVLRPIRPTPERDGLSPACRQGQERSRKPSKPLRNMVEAAGIEPAFISMRSGTYA